MFNCLEVPSLLMSQLLLDIVRQNLAEVAIGQRGKHKQRGRKGKRGRRRREVKEVMVETKMHGMLCTREKVEKERKRSLTG